MGVDAGSPRACSVHLDEPHDGWDAIYAAKGACGVSWYQASPSPSVQWIEALAPEPTSQLIDVGAGASTLVDALLKRGYRAITLLDQSAIALAMTRERLQADPVLAQWVTGIDWLQGDLLDAVLPHHGYDLWHDRAVFHFFTSESERQRYRQLLRQALRPGGHLILATFAADGPSHCSGQPVRRYSLEDLVLALGPGFDLVDHRQDRHLTPAGHGQPFLHACFRWQPNGTT